MKRIFVFCLVLVMLSVLLVGCTDERNVSENHNGKIESSSASATTESSSHATTPTSNSTTGENGNNNGLENGNGNNNGLGNGNNNGATNGNGTEHSNGTEETTSPNARTRGNVLF